jgi:hypothetical protein
MVQAPAYVSEQLALMVGHPVVPTPAQVAQFWAYLSGDDEQSGALDVHGRISPESLGLVQRGEQEDPPLHRSLLAWLAQPPFGQARWPQGARFAACLTHDVDHLTTLPWRERVRQLRQVGGQVSRERRLRWGMAAGIFATGMACGLAQTAPYDEWMMDEARFGFRSTFFVLPERLSAPHPCDAFYTYADPVHYCGKRMAFAAATRQVRREGWEIGLHGSYASAFDVRVLADEKRQLEAMLGMPVASVRQHFLRFRVTETPHIQAAAGFHADSSVGFASLIGCRAGIAFPFFWPQEPELLEVPLLIQDIGLLTGGSAHWSECLMRAQALVHRVAAVGGVLTLDWHTHSSAPGARACYQALLATIADLGGWGCTLAALTDWWRERRAALRGERIGGASDKDG